MRAFDATTYRPKSEWVSKTSRLPPEALCWRESLLVENAAIAPLGCHEM
jgi:hypothetical protein